MIKDNPPVYQRRKSGKPVFHLPQTANVLSVYKIDGTGALWVFSSPVVVNELCPQLRILTASGWQTPSATGPVSPYLVACDYDSGDLDADQPWEIVEQPVGLDFGAVAVPVPQNGVVVR